MHDAFKAFEYLPLKTLLSETLNFLKFRFGYGTSAGYPDPYLTRQTLQLTTAQFTPPSSSPINTNSSNFTFPNADLKPELHREFELGLETNMWKNRITFDGSIYKRTSKDQILNREDGGQDFIIQITDARPDTGGLSGATLQEGKSWGKVQDAHEDVTTVYADSTIAFPILALYALKTQKNRKPKRIFKKIDIYAQVLMGGHSP